VSFQFRVFALRLDQEGPIAVSVLLQLKELSSYFCLLVRCCPVSLRHAPDQMSQRPEQRVWTFAALTSGSIASRSSDHPSSQAAPERAHDSPNLSCNKRLSSMMSYSFHHPLTCRSSNVNTGWCGWFSANGVYDSGICGGDIITTSLKFRILLPTAEVRGENRSKGKLQEEKLQRIFS